MEDRRDWYLTDADLGLDKRLEIEFYRLPDEPKLWFCRSPQLPGIDGHGYTKAKALKDWAQDVEALWESLASEPDENLAGDAIRSKRTLREVLSDE